MNFMIVFLLKKKADLIKIDIRETDILTICFHFVNISHTKYQKKFSARIGQIGIY